MDGLKAADLCETPGNISGNAGYRNALLIATCEKICNNIKQNSKENGQTKKNTQNSIAIAPYNHGITRRLKNIAVWQGVHVVCSVPNKAYPMCRRANQEAEFEGEVCDIDKVCIIRKRSHI